MNHSQLNNPKLSASAKSHLIKLRLKNCVLQKRKIYRSLDNEKKSNSLDFGRFSDVEDKNSKSVDHYEKRPTQTKLNHRQINSMFKSQSTDSCDLRKTMSEPSLRFKTAQRHKMIKTKRQLTNNLTMTGAIMASSSLLNAPMDERSIANESSSLPDLLQNSLSQQQNSQRFSNSQLKQRLNLLRYRQHIGHVNRTQSAPQPLAIQHSITHPDYVLNDQKDFTIWNKGNNSEDVSSNDEVSNYNSRYNFLYQLRRKLIEKSELMSNYDLLRTISSPIVANTVNVVGKAPKRVSGDEGSSDDAKPIDTISTGLAYDLGMLAHHCTCQNDVNHPENPSRLIVIWQHLKNTCLAERCLHLNGRRAGLNEIQLVHDDVYTILFGSNPAARSRIDPSLLSKVRLCRLSCGGVGIDSDTTWHTAGHTSHAARLAVGCVSDLCYRIISGQLYNGFAIVRPPGHLAESGLAMGFCYFNSVAISAKTIQLLKENNGSRRIAIIDWDIHHGNGTQSYFYSDSSVLYISLHRYDDGDFFPGTGKMTEIGSSSAAGMNINIPWPKGIPMGDAEYLAAFRAIVLPVLKEFHPDLIIVSAGFDGCLGHSNAIGGYLLSPALFGWLTLLLGDYRVVLALEGGYELKSLAESVEACVRALIISANQRFRNNNQKSHGTTTTTPTCETKLLPLSNTEKTRIPNSSAMDCLEKVMLIHGKYWKCLRDNLQRMRLDIPVDKWVHDMDGQEMASQHTESMEAFDGLPNSVKRLHEDFSTIIRRRSFRKQKVFEEEEEGTNQTPTEANLTPEAFFSSTVRKLAELSMDKD